jgi:hypothetical protein
MSGQKQWKSTPEMQVDPSKLYSATLHTSKGDITFDLLMSDAPKTVNNFVFLAREGFYDGAPFHRIIKGFMIQGATRPAPVAVAPATASPMSGSAAVTSAGSWRWRMPARTPTARNSSSATGAMPRPCRRATRSSAR